MLGQHQRNNSNSKPSLSGEKACKGSTLALKPRVDVTKVQNKGISGPTQRTYVLQN